jgi:antitoxin MazE
MQARIQKWGNSLAIRIPKAFAEEAGLETDSPVEITLYEGRLVISPRHKPKYTLEELLAQVTDDNIHEEIDTGPSVGNEAW